MEKVDLLVEDTEVYNSYLKQFINADVYIKGTKIYYVDTEHRHELEAVRVLDGRGLLKCFRGLLTFICTSRVP